MVLQEQSQPTILSIYISDSDKNQAPSKLKYVVCTDKRLVEHQVQVFKKAKTKKKKVFMSLNKDEEARFYYAASANPTLNLP